jgi:tetratricopeptide (TPR) repeat protein
MQRALELKPRFLEAYVTLTDIHTRLREYPQAIAYNSKGLSYFPQESGLHYARGVMYHTKRRLDSALYSYQKAMIFDSTNYLADFQAGTIYLKWNMLPMAVRSFEKVARFNPKFPKINLLLGAAYDRIGYLDKALEQYTLASNSDPGDWRLKGRLYKLQQRKNYFDTYGTLPPATHEVAGEVAEVVPSIPEKTLDTSRIRINILTPKLELKNRNDTGRILRIK